MYQLILVVVLIKYSLSLFEKNESVFLNPQTNSAFIQCPLNYIDIQWDDVRNQRFNISRGQFYRLDGLQSFNRVLICSSISTDEKYKIRIEIYDRPLPVQEIRILKITNSSLTIQWIDNPSNQNANITSYELILKFNNLLQSHILVNSSSSLLISTFSSLQANRFYSIDLSVVDIWKRSSESKRIYAQTLPYNSNETIFFNQIIAQDLLDQSIGCYQFNHNNLLIEFSPLKYQMKNHIYNLTIFNNQNHRQIFTTNLQSSLIYSLKDVNLKYEIKLILSTIQSEYLGEISKSCEEFYPIYSPLTCSIKVLQQNQYHLFIYLHLSHSKQYIKSLKPHSIFYRIHPNHLIKKNLDQIHQYLVEKISDVKDNYTVIVENEFFDKKYNISILCTINRRDLISFNLSKTILIGCVLLILCLIILILILVYKKFHPNARKKYHITHKFDSIPIPIDQFPFYVSNMHQNNDAGFNRLFENISKDLLSHTNETKISIPIDDYINAYYINGYEKTNVYIVMEGSRMNHFWRMIWEKDVSVIVMITNLNKKNWNVYWPEESIEIFEDIEVTLIKTISLAYYIHRIFAIRCHNNQQFINCERLVHQYHYLDWPDHTPSFLAIPILSFIRRSSASHSELNGPMVVLCSRGIYLIVDIILKKLNEQEVLNIPSIVKYVCQQRKNLVQNEEEFIFIYDLLLEVVQLFNIGYKNLDLTKDNFSSIIQTLHNYDQKFDSTRIDQQFQLILEQTGEEYINTSYLHGYFHLDEFIIIQHPVSYTSIDFWRMIWDKNIDTIVALYTDENLSSDVFVYWPSLNQVIECGYFNVSLIDEHFQCEYIYRDCLLQSTKDNSELSVKIISNSYWPEACSPISTSFNLINIIRNLNSNKPIVVHDYIGGHRAGTFCALYTMKDQLENEGILNVYELAKFYQIKRPGIWPHSDDLLFLYHCAEILFHQS